MAHKEKKAIGPHTLEIHSIIYGTLLGHSHAERRSYKTKRGNTLGNTRISFQQENSNVSYLMWLWKIFSTNNYCTQKKPKVLNRIGTRGKKRYYLRINTYTYGTFNWYRDQFYDSEGKKHVPKNLEKHLNPLALACWFMDDGSKTAYGCKFVTNSFSYEDCTFICKVLSSRYDINATVQKAGIVDQWVVYIKADSLSKFQKVILPHLNKSMYYKIHL